MLPEHQPDREEKVVRFIFGFLAGAVISVFSWLQWQFRLDVFLILGALIASSMGILAVRYGDRFWHALLRLFPWC